MVSIQALDSSLTLTLVSVTDTRVYILTSRAHAARLAGSNYFAVFVSVCVRVRLYTLMCMQVIIGLPRSLMKMVECSHAALFVLKGHGQDVRAQIFLRIRIISLEFDGVVFKLQSSCTFDHPYRIYRLT